MTARTAKTVKKAKRRTPKVRTGELRVVVTKEDIKLGRRYDNERCPIARALARASKEPVGSASVGYLYARVYSDNGPLKSGDLPGEVREFVNDFDNRIGVKPFSFTWRYSNVD